MPVWGEPKHCEGINGAGCECLIWDDGDFCSECQSILDSESSFEFECMKCGNEWNGSQSESCPQCGWNGVHVGSEECLEEDFKEDKFCAICGDYYNSEYLFCPDCGQDWR